MDLTFPNPRAVALRRAAAWAPMVLLAGALTACAPTVREFDGGRAVREIEVSQKGPVAGVGIEGSDIVRMTDAMMRDMLAEPVLGGRPVPPRVIVDAEHFVNDSMQALNRHAITNRLRVALNRSSQGRMVFIARHFDRMVAQESALRGNPARPRATADYRLGGRIVSLDSRNQRTGEIQRYNQITFEMVDLAEETVVWSGIYEFQRAATDDIVYR